MPQLDVNRDAARCVLVYYGPRQAGKSTTLQAIRRALPPAQRGDVLVRPSGAHPTLFVEHLRARPRWTGDLALELDLVAVPEHEALPLLGDLLSVTDGVVFVGDAQGRRVEQDRAALRALEEALRLARVDLGALPFAFQWNKRDLPGALAPADLARAVGARGRPGFHAVATTGHGVLSPLREVALAAARRLGSARDPDAPARAVPTFGRRGPSSTRGRARRAA